MNLHEAIGNDPLSASLLWSGAGVCRFAVAPTLRQPRLSRQQTGHGHGHLFPFKLSWRAPGYTEVRITAFFWTLETLGKDPFGFWKRGPSPPLPLWWEESLSVVDPLLLYINRGMLKLLSLFKQKSFWTRQHPIWQMEVTLRVVCNERLTGRRGQEQGSYTWQGYIRQITYLGLVR